MRFVILTGLTCAAIALAGCTAAPGGNASANAAGPANTAMPADAPVPIGNAAAPVPDANASNASRTAPGGDAPAPQTATGDLPVQAGFYAQNSSCAAAGGQDAVVHINARRMVDFMGAMVFFTGFDDLGGGRYRVRARTFDEADRATATTFTIRLRDGGGFTTDDGDTYVPCPAAQVPAELRRSLPAY